jgi:hypothetical protein
MPEFKLTLARLTMASLVLAATSLDASAAHTKKHKRATAAPTTTSSALCRGANLFHCGPIYNGNDYLGTDPDPFIRLMIQRDLGAKYGGDD